MSGVGWLGDRPSEFQPAAVVGGLDHPPAHAWWVVSWRLRRIHKAADQAELAAERAVGLAVEIEECPGGRGVATQPGQHSFDPGLGERVHDLWADAELDGLAVPH